MKKTAITLFVSLLVCVSFAGDYLIPQMTGLDYNATKMFDVDVTESSGLALQLSFHGEGYYTTTAVLGITNVPSQGDAIGLKIGGVNSLYTWTTNTPTTSQIAIGASTASSATNLALKILAQHPTDLTVDYSGAPLLSIATLGNPGFTFTNTPVWNTNVITTNAIAGALIVVASNSLDKTVWFPDTAKNFRLAYSGTSVVSCLSNWPSIGAVGHYRFAVNNHSTNYAIPQGLQIKSGVKTGL